MNPLEYFIWGTQRGYLEVFDSIPTNCPYCKSDDIYVVEVDIGEYREYGCPDCLKHFYGKNPSHSS